MPPAAEAKTLIPEPGTVVVRMYRIGHGDCFLIAYRGKGGSVEPVYILIDCGYKPGSNSAAFINTNVDEIVKSIGTATGNHIHVAVITHEHQDHVNAISAKRFEDFTIDEAWFAWTEDPEDDLANDLRKQYHDRLLQLIEARNQLTVDGAMEQVRELDEFIEFSLGGEEGLFDFAATSALLGADGDTSPGLNKKSMKVFKDLANKNRGIEFLSPHTKPRIIEGAADLRVYVLGPPRDGQKLTDEDPVGSEGFPRLGLAADSNANLLGEALRKPTAPFSPRYCVALTRDGAGKPESPTGDWKLFYEKHYGVGAVPRMDDVVEDNAEFRRIDSDWLYSATELALKMGDFINNTSLVLAFELGVGGKVLLFAADAQRGNWISWADADFKDGTRKVTSRDLLSRTVLYKVGHHGSHNATLQGEANDSYANLFWMGEGDYASEFTAMITAVRKWAQQPTVQWDHPLKSIKDALLKKACGRVFQTDTDFSKLAKSPHSPQRDWDSFQSRAQGRELYFDYTITF